MIIKWIINFIRKILVWLGIVKRIKFEINGFSGGLNTNDSAYQLNQKKAPELSTCYNVRVNDIGNALKRSGFTKLQAAAIEASKYVTAIYQYSDDYGNKTIYAICGAKLYYWTGTAFTELSDFLGVTKTLTNNKRASIFTWKNNLFVSNGEDPAFEYGQQTLYTQDAIYTMASETGDTSEQIVYGLTGSELFKFGSSGPGRYQFAQAWGIDVDTTNSKVYVADTNNARIIVYNLKGTYQFQFGTSGSGNGQFSSPTDVAVDETGSQVYVTDKGNNRIQYFDLNGNYVGQWGSAGTGNGEFDEPYGIDVDETGSQVYVTDNGNNRVQYFSLTGTYAGQWGGDGTGDGQFSNPFGIDVDENGSQVYVVDSDNRRVQYFSLTGTYAGQWGSLGTGDGEFNEPSDVIVDETNSQVYVSDYNNTRIQYFSLTGTYAGQWTTNTKPYGMGIGSNLTTTANVFHDLGSPVSCKAADAGSGTGKTGTYKYKLTYETSSGETSGGIESNAIAVVDNDISLTEIPAPPLAGDEDCEVSYINIYRSKDGAAYAYIDRITISTDGNYSFSTSYDDSTIDGAEDTTNICPTMNTVVPTFKYLIQFKDTLFGAGDYDYPNRLYWTNVLNQNDWFGARGAIGEGGYWEPIGTDEGTVITGLAVLGDYLYVFKEDSIWYINVTAEDDLVTVGQHNITKEYGCVSGFTIDYATIRGRNGLVFADKDKGLCFLVDGAVGSLSRKIQSDWSALSKLYLGNAVGKVYPKLNEYWLALTASGTTNNQVYPINLNNGAIMKPFVMNVTSLGKVTVSGIEYLYSGDFSGFVYKQDSGNDDGGSNIDGYFDTGWIDCGFPGFQKIFDKVTVIFNQKGSWNMALYWAVDGGAFTDTVNISLAGTAGVQDKHTQALIDSTNGRTMQGKTIRFRIRNTTKDQPFEVCKFIIDARVERIRTP
jgi:DNA-binding beta-propeller fold protein YncE